jgi:glutamyl-tRNA synthetase
MADEKVRVRFAPSPTGKLHIGGARTAIYNWAFARANDGVFVLRIDDTDPTRSTKENEGIILRAMRWLGLDWDEGPEVGGPYGPYKQAERLEIYTDVANRLLEEGKAYYCFCTADELAAAKKAAEERKDPFQGYQRTCRNIDPAEAKRRVEAGEPHVIRIKVPDGRGDVVVHDLVHGDVVFNARELDDFVIVRTDGSPTYNFATVVDDALMKITHVIRGDDHLSNTPRQVMVYEAMGAPTPTFAHLSMILGPDGKKLSKRHGATSVEEYKAEGYDPDALVNYLALLGWSLDGETTVIPRDVLAKEFDLSRISKNPSIADPKKLSWLNSEYYARMSDLEFAENVLEKELVAAGAVKPGAVDADPEWWALLAQILKPRTKVATDVPGLCGFLFCGPTVELDEKSFNKTLAKPGARACLDAARAALVELGPDDWETGKIDAALAPLADALGVSKRVFFGAVRVAETGNMVSPPLGESMELLGFERAIKRLDVAIERAAE